MKSVVIRDCVFAVCITVAAIAFGDARILWFMLLIPFV